MLPIDISQPISDFVMMVNSNHGRITYPMRDILSFVAHCILIADSYSGGTPSNINVMYIIEKYF